MINKGENNDGVILQEQNCRRRRDGGPPTGLTSQPEVASLVWNTKQIITITLWFTFIMYHSLTCKIYFYVLFFSFFLSSYCYGCYCGLLDSISNIFDAHLFINTVSITQIRKWKNVRWRGENKAEIQMGKRLMA